MKTILHIPMTFVAVLMFLSGSLPSLSQTFYAADANGNTIQYWSNGTEAIVKGLTSVSDDASKAGHIVIPATVHYENGNTDFPVTKIDSWAFNSNTNLLEINFTDATELTTIDVKAFNGCKSLTNVELPTNLTTLGSYCFDGCSGLQSISFPDGLTVIPEYCFLNCSALQNITLGTGITTIENHAFYGCRAMETFTANQALKTIDSYAIEYCTSLTVVDLTPASGFTTLGQGAFYRCSELKEVRFPASVESIEYRTFSECPNLNKVVLPGATVPFTGETNLQSTAFLWVPANMVDAYAANDYTKNYRTIVIDALTDYAVTTADGGELQAKVEALGSASNCINLKVTGPINGTDINYIHQRLTGLQNLDLGDAQIVSGGDSYNTFNVADNGTATATSESYNTEDNIVGRAMFYNMPTLRRIVLPTTATVLGRSALGKCTALEECIIPEGVTEIQEYCFANSTGISSNANKIKQMTLPSTLRTIGDYAFAYMNKWENVSIPEGVTKVPQYAFYYCQAMKSVSIPNSVTEISNRAFYRCSAFESLTLPVGLTTMGNEAFGYCSALSGTITLPGTMKKVPEGAFYYCSAIEGLVLNEGIEEIDNDAFERCSAIRTISFPSTLTTMDYDAFAYCKSLETVNLPASLTSLGTYAFYDCDSLRAFTFPDAITSVPDHVLAGCDNLESVVLAPQTTTIGNNAFRDCPKLTSVNFDLATLTKIENDAFNNTGFTSVLLPEQVVVNSGCFANCNNLLSINVPSANTKVPGSFAYSCKALTNVTLPATITNIESSAFMYCSALPTIDLPAGLTTIGNYVFQYCTALALNTLPASLTSIGTSAFSGCKAITSITIPASVTNVNANAFWGTGLRSVIFECPNPTMGTYVFRQCDSLTNVVLPYAMKSLPYGTFYYCSSLPSITLPATLKSLGGYTFYHCEKLAAIQFPEGLNTIEDNDFEHTAITEVNIPDSVTKIGNYVFAYCYNLKRATLGRNQDYTQNNSFNYFFYCDSLETLRIYAGMPPAIDSYYAPHNRENITLEVPAGTADLYSEADVWKEFGTLQTFLTGDKLHATDYAIMKLFYTQMNGDNWEKPWDLTTDDRYIGKWQGVTTEGDHIVSIDLTAQGLSGELKADIFSLPCLTTLNLSDNAITGRLEEVFSAEAVADTVLTNLNLCGNQLEGDAAPFAAKLPRLTKCNLSYNRLTAVSALIDRTYLRNQPDYLDLRYQFVDYRTKAVIVTEQYPALQARLGVPFSWEPNSLQTYRQDSQDWGRKSDYLYNGYSYENTWYHSMHYSYKNTHWFKKNSEGLYAANGDCSVFDGTREPVMMDLGTNGYATQPFQFDWLEGDVNIDLTLDVTDLQAVIYYAVNDNRPSSVPFNYTTANCNGDDKLNVLDCIISVNRILDYEEQGTHASRALYNIMYDTRNTMNLERGTLSLRNNDEVAAMQFTLYGCRADDITLCGALSDFNLASKQQADGSVRVIIYSLNGNTITTGETTLLKDLPAGTSIGDVRLSDAQGTRLKAAIAEDVTGINGISTTTDVQGDIYDMLGRHVASGNVATQLKTLPTGVYIVKTQDGQFKIRK